MALYSRLVASRSRTTDEVLAFLISYPADRRVQGITVGDLARDHNLDPRSVTAAIDLLREEGMVIEERSGGHADARDVIRAYPVMAQEIPPQREMFDHREQHPHSQHTIVLDFYKVAKDDYFVWPYIDRVRGDGATAKHFPLRRHFQSLDEARDSALTIARTLIAVGFDVNHVE